MLLNWRVAKKIGWDTRLGPQEMMEGLGANRVIDLIVERNNDLIPGQKIVLELEDCKKRVEANYNI